MIVRSVKSFTIKGEFNFAVKKQLWFKAFDNKVSLVKGKFDCKFELINQPWMKARGYRISQVNQQRVNKYKFELQILYHNRHRRSATDEASVGPDVVFCPNLLDLCRQADFIIICCPLTEQTRNLISTQHFDNMKSNAIFVNVARGQVITR